MNNKYIYKHIRLDTNEVFYIGVGTPCKKCKDKENKYYYRRAYTEENRNIFWKRVTEKTEWRYEIILEDLSLEEADIKERQLIKKYGRRSLGEGTLVNLAEGGNINSGWKTREEVKLKISKANKGRVFTEEHKKKIGKASKKYRLKNPQVLSEKTKKRISKTLKGTREGKNNSFYGKKHTKETKEKWKKSRLGYNNYNAVVILDTETGIFYDTIKEASEAKSINYGTLRYKMNPKNINTTSFIRI